MSDCSKLNMHNFGVLIIEMPKRKIRLNFLIIIFLRLLSFSCSVHSDSDLRHCLIPRFEIFSILYIRSIAYNLKPTRYDIYI